MRKPIPIRLPEDVRDWLDREATYNASTINGEVVRAIREKMDRTLTAKHVSPELLQGVNHGR